MTTMRMGGISQNLAMQGSRKDVIAGSGYQGG
jgi:hypothetical protein